MENCKKKKCNIDHKFTFFKLNLVTHNILSKLIFYILKPMMGIMHEKKIVS